MSNNKIIYRKTLDYDDISTNSTNSIYTTDGLDELDDSVISIETQSDNIIEHPNSNFNEIQKLNQNLISDINKELEIGLKNNKHYRTQENFNIVQPTQLNHKLESELEHELEHELESELEPELDTITYNKILTKDINFWIFIGMITISLLIILMMVINKK